MTHWTPTEFVYVPKHTSWLNQVEIWFSVLARRVLRRGNFRSVADLREKILAYIAYHRQHASIDSQTEFFIEYLKKLSPQEAVRKAGLCAEKFWLFRGGGACERRLPT